MNTSERHADILTPDQVARELQVDRETVYRYIRSGKLSASRLGRSYRIPRQSIELLLLATSTRPYIKLRHYTDEQIEQFMQEDVLDGEALEVARRFDRAMGGAFFGEDRGAEQPDRS